MKKNITQLQPVPKKIILGIIIFSSLILTFCDQSKHEDQSKKKVVGDEKKIILNQDEREFQKAGELNIKLRNTISYFYKNSGERADRGYLVERVVFDKSGNRIEQINFKSTGDIDLKWVYKYDDKNNLIRSETYNIFDDLVGWSDIEYDDNGIEISRREMNRTIKGISVITYQFDESGYLKEKVVKDSDGDIISKENMVFDNKGYLIKRSSTNKDDNLISEINLDYDSLGHLVKEDQLLPGYTQTSTIYKYDTEENLILKDAGYYHQEFKYDRHGNIIEESLFDKEGYRQQKFVYTYDQRNLLVEKVRYDSEDKPFLYVKYEYEFY